MTDPDSGGLPPLVDPTSLPAADPAAVASACAAVRAFCGWHIAPSVTTTYARRPESRVLLLPSLHITEVTSVIENGNAIDSSVWDEDLVESGMLKRLHGVWCGRVAVEFEHGYDACPPEIVSVVAALSSAGVEGFASQMQAGPFGMSANASQQAGASALSLVHQRVLGPYVLQAGA